MMLVVLNGYHQLGQSVVYYTNSNTLFSQMFNVFYIVFFYIIHINVESKIFSFVICPKW